MTKRSLAILLGISIVFNLAVLGSIFWLRTTRPFPPIPREARPPRPDLPEHIIRMDRDPEMQRAREQFEQSKMQLMQELRKDPIDEELIRSIIATSLEAQNELERHLGNRLLHLRKQMTAQEAEAYFGTRIEYMQNRKHHNRHPRRRPNEKTITD